MKIETLKHQLEMFLFHKQFADRLISVNWNWFLIRPLKNLFFEREVSEPNEKTQTSRLKFSSCCGETTMQSTSSTASETLLHVQSNIFNNQSWGVAKSFVYTSIMSDDVISCSFSLIYYTRLRSLVFVCAMMAMNNLRAL